MILNYGCPSYFVGYRCELPNLAGWCHSTASECPKSGLRHRISQFRRRRVLAGQAVETEIRDQFGSWGDPATRGRLKEDQNVCDVRPGTWIPIPTLFRQHPDIFRQTEDASVCWSQWSLSGEDQPGRGVGWDVREWTLLCEDLGE